MTGTRGRVWGEGRWPWGDEVVMTRGVDKHVDWGEGVGWGRSGGTENVGEIRSVWT